MSILFIGIFFFEVHNDFLSILGRFVFHDKSGEIEELMILSSFCVSISKPNKVLMFAWDTSNEINETIFYIYFIDLKVSNCGYLVTHMSSHLLILEYFTCICPLASGTDGSMGKRVTM
jgi:hypothetical protein